MKHLGSVTEIHGAEVPQVDTITFGSPCQDLSVAGKRAGIQDGERSNLFFEAIRIIKEMRDSTNGEYPKYAVWENVPGAFSSNKGRDFHAVLEALCSVCDDTVSIPKPYDAKRTKFVWNKAGEIVGDNYSIAWRTLDAQHWGVPQRRKRIYLVADFTGGCAGEILFKQEGRIWDSKESGKARESFTINAMGGTDGTNRNGGMIYGQEEAANAREILSEVRGAIGSEGLEEWLRGTIVFFQRTKVLQFEMCQSEDREKPNNSGELPPNGKRYIPGNDVLCGLQKDLKNGNTPHRQEPIEQLTEQFGEIVQKLSLKTTQEQSSLLDLWKTSESKRFLPTSLFRVSEPFKNGETFSRRYGKSVAVTADAVGSVDGSIRAVGIDGYNFALTGDKAATVGVNCGISTGRNGVIEGVNGSVGAAGVVSKGDGDCFIMPERHMALSVGGGQAGQGYPCTVYSFDSLSSNSMKSSNPNSGCRAVKIAKCIDTTYPDPSKNQGGVAVVQAVIGIDHVITTGGNCTAQGSCVYEDTQATLKAGGVHAVCYDARNHNAQDISGTIQAKSNGGQSLNYINPVCYDARGNGDGETVLFEPRSPDGEPRIYDDICPTLNTAQGGQRQPCIVENSNPPRKYIIRRLTPTECARLQGFPDDWGQLAPYNPADADFWEDVRKTHAEINGKKYKPVKNLKKWYDKLHTDSAEYKMWGNGIALPNARYVIQGIAEQGAKTLGSLFDGSGGFPLAGVLNGITPLWASEVEPYPIAVTVSRFGRVKR